MNGTIVTFYSFKGGVGRSMCLANIAVLLARKYKVLVIDFDLEAPGLDKYFSVFNTKSGKKHGGVLEILEQAQNSTTPYHEDYIQTITDPKINYFHFLSSGNHENDYSQRVQNFNWDSFFEKYKGTLFLENLRSKFIEAYDFILIDSRTGYSDTSGICTYFMPDILTLLFTANNQSVQGSIEVADKSLSARQKLPFDRSKLTIFPIPSRIDKTEEYESAKEWNQKFITLFSTYYKDWFPPDWRVDLILEEVSIPYLAIYSFGEKIAVMDINEINRKVSPAYYFNQISRILDGSFFSDEKPKTNTTDVIDNLIKKYNQELNDRQVVIIREIHNNGFVKSNRIREILNISYDTVNRDTNKLIELGIVKVTGKGRSTKYIAGTEMELFI
jgi:hypothetical protein